MHHDVECKAQCMVTWSTPLQVADKLKVWKLPGFFFTQCVDNHNMCKCMACHEASFLPDGRHICVQSHLRFVLHTYCSQDDDVVSVAKLSLQLCANHDQ